ncbi:cyclin-dependent kinase inhibitor 1B-like isoform X1 [Bufo bufo]|uniref:cyclin-dependent kinase inhibitor 1B-like isoform X1 n=1 Tax=Bufo bufo TaxID=8384 RepID=UPI001ABEBA45|nr:cyclin-dependent kinase inhibitor 1B-like isoform X1 [Bufo bufo]
MSGVRLSPGSPGVERVSRAPGSPRTPARRCLFGPVDHESLARELARCRRELEDEQRERWNFDFRNERPLDGALSWEVAGPDTPEFYRRGPHLKPGAAQLHPRAGAGEETEARGNKRSGELTEPPSSKKSHRTETGEPVEGSSASSPEKTPKKSRPST